MDKEAAKSAYASAWLEYILGSSERKKQLCTVMDEIQKLIMGREKIAGDRDYEDEWLTFTGTLPGYMEYWSAQLMKHLNQVP